MEPYRDANDRPATRRAGLHFLIPLIIFGSVAKI